MSTIVNNKLPLTRIQKLIGRLMLHSKRHRPCCYLKVQIDLTRLIAIRKPYCKAVGVSVTTNDFFFYAIAQAAKTFPLMTARLDETGSWVQIPEKFGVGFAITAPQGLVVPVIKNSTEKSLPEIAIQSSELVKKARANKLVPDDFDGTNIVFSSLGMYGLNSFFAVVPPDATAIFSIGKLNDTIVPIDDNFIARKIMSISLAVDRTIVDEFYAAAFLRCVAEQLENPEVIIG